MPKITREGGPSIAAESAEAVGLAPDEELADSPDDAADAGPSNAEIRAWAAEAGVEVSPSGPIPKAVREQYDAAHAPVQN